MWSHTAEAKAKIKASRAKQVMGRGTNANGWKGNRIGWRGAHKRVLAMRGQPKHCEHCGTTEGKLHWAFAGLGHDQGTAAFSTDPNDYISLCTQCHKKFDR